MQGCTTKREAMTLVREKLDAGFWVHLEDIRDDDSTRYRYRVSWKRRP